MSSNNTKIQTQTPRERGEEKAMVALNWIYRWGFTSPSIIELLIDHNRNGLASRLAKAGLIQKTKTASGPATTGLPGFILTLTETGQDQVERTFTSDEELLPQQLDPHKINQRLLRHDLLCQQLTVNRMLSTTSNMQFEDYRSPKELTRKSAKGQKQPDAIWLLRDKAGQLRKYALEIELSAKWSRDLDEFVGNYVKALTGTDPKFDGMLLFTDSPALQERYSKAFRPSANYGIWQQTNTRHYSQTGTARIPAEMEGKVTCKKI